MELRDIRWVAGRFGLTYGMIGTHRVATIEHDPRRTPSPAYHVHLSGSPILGERTKKLPAWSLAEGQLIASQKIVQFINHFTQEVHRYATDEEDRGATVGESQERAGRSVSSVQKQTGP